MARTIDLGLVRAGTINDNMPSAENTYSSQKIEEELTQLNQANAAQDKEIANKLGKTERASDSKKLDGKDSVYFLRPRNLLDNSDFTNPVVQAGTNGIHGVLCYVADRWINSANAAADKQSDGLVVNGETDICQNLERYDIMAGKTYTIALKTFDGLYCTSFVMGAVSGGLVLSEKITFFSIPEMNIVFRQTGWNKYVWAALYEGEYTAETLPPYVSKGYGTELNECRRYYQPDIPVSVIALNTNYVQINAFHAPPMRKNPSRTVKTLYNSSVPLDITDSTLSGNVIATSQGYFPRVTLTQGAPYSLTFDADADL